MNKSTISLIVVLVLVVVGSISFAAPVDRGYYDYLGTIGKAKIAASLHLDEDDSIKGSYIYDKYRKEIKVEGKTNGSNITFSEYDSKKKLVGTFEGKFNKDDSIKGFWKDAKTGKKTEFTMNLVSALPFQEYNHRYAQLGVTDDREVDTFVTSFQKMVNKNDKVGISKLVQYPLLVNKDGKSLQIKDAKTFIKNYDSIMTPSLKKDLSAAYTQYLFANSDGLMFGSNSRNVWITGIVENKNHVELKIFSLNQ